MDMYFVYSNGNEIRTFRGKNKFIKETINTFNECVALYHREWDSEAKLLGFNLTPYEFDEDDDCLGGGEIIMDNDCYNACIKFWESYGTPCKVVIKKGEE